MRRLLLCACLAVAACGAARPLEWGDGSGGPADAGADLIGADLFRREHPCPSDVQPCEVYEQCWIDIQSGEVSCLRPAT